MTQRRNLTKEEQALWNRMAQEMKPLSPGKKRIVQCSPQNKYGSAQPTLSQNHSFSSNISYSQSLSLPPASSRRIGRVRKIKIEARLDLHGLTCEQARIHVIQFLISCQNRGCLWVLVITGKGQRRLTPEESYKSRPSKTLRDLTPQWLEEDVLQAVVSAYTTAKPLDGGNGALYIRLKRANL